MKRLFEFVIFSLAGFLLVQSVLMHLGAPGPRSDLDILLLAGQRFSEGLPVYNISDFAEHTKPPLLSPFLAILARLPAGWLRGFWDSMNIALPFMVLTFWSRIWNPGTNPWRRREFWLNFGLCLILLRGAWRTEIDFGQFNLFLLSLQLFAFYLAKKERLMTAGALAAFSVLLKPSQIFLLPWLFYGMPKITRTRVALFLAGATSLIGFMALLYILYRPASELLYAHLDWLSFMRESTAKHIARLDNFSIPSLLARQQIGWASSPWVTLAGVGFLLVVCLKRMLPAQSCFHLAVGINLCLSVMTWWQNFVILFPAAFDLINSRLHSRHRILSLAGCVCLALPNLVKPAWLGGQPLEAAWKATALPLWLSTSAVGILLLLNSRPNAAQK